MYRLILPPSDEGIPLYEQIYRQIKKEIQTGLLKSNSSLPSKRTLAAHLGVSVNTVSSAYEQLLSEGYIVAVARKGFYISHLDEFKPLNHAGSLKKQASSVPATEANPLKIDFSPSDTAYGEFPFNTWRKLLKDIFNQMDPQLFKSSPPQGDPEFREAVTRYLHESRGVNCTPDQLIIGAGTDYLLLILSMLLPGSGLPAYGSGKITGSGQRLYLVMENPVYNKAYRIFESMGHKVISLPIDEKGLPVAPLHTMKVSAVYITPSHQFPLGISMPISRRIQLINWASLCPESYIIEDDYDSEFRYGMKPIPSLQSIDAMGRVIYLGTFSKAIAPSVRISYMVLPPSLLEAYHKGPFMSACPVSRHEQKLLTAFLDGGFFERHLNKMRKHYSAKRELLVSQLEAFNSKGVVLGENAGHHLLYKPNLTLSEEELLNRAQAQGVKIYGLSPYFSGKVPENHAGTVLLGYGGLTDRQIFEGTALLSDAWS